MIVPPSESQKNNDKANDGGGILFSWPNAVINKLEKYHFGNRDNSRNKNIDGQLQEQDLDRRTVILSLLCSIFLCPIAFHVTNCRPGSFESDILAGVLVITVSAILVYIINNVVRQGYRYQSSAQAARTKGTANQHDHQGKSSSSAFSASSNKTIFNVFYSQEFKEKLKSNQHKIDPKYFNPRFIIQELIEMWGTTYSVITWSSFYIVGGTMNAGEKLAAKIKTKYTSGKGTDRFGSPRGARSEETLNASGDSNNNNFNFNNYTTNCNSEEIRHQKKSSLRRVTSWSKRSFESTRKKLSRLIGRSSEPLLSIGELENSLNTSLQ